MLSYPVPGDLLLISLHSSVGIHPGVSAPFDSNLTLARMTPKCIGVTLFGPQPSPRGFNTTSVQEKTKVGIVDCGEDVGLEPTNKGATLGD